MLARLQPLFQAMGKQVFHMGETSKGQATKLVMNLQIALIYEGFAEALTLAAKLGVDVEKLLPLIQASMVRSGVVDYKAPFILKRDFSPNFPLRLMLKDIRLALEAAKESRVRLPGLEAVEEVYDVAAEEGQQDLDYAATLTLLEKWAGVEVRPHQNRDAEPEVAVLAGACRASLGLDGRDARPHTSLTEIVVAVGVELSQNDSAAKIANGLHVHETRLIVIACLSVVYAVMFVIFYLSALHNLLRGDTDRTRSLVRWCWLEECSS